MADAAALSGRRPGVTAAFGLLLVYTVGHFLHAVVGRTGYDDFLLLMRATRAWLSTRQFEVGFWYPPFFFLVNSPLALCPNDQAAAWVMLGINHGLLAAGLWLLMVTTRPLVDSRRLWWWVLLPLVLNFRPLLLLVSMAKIEMLQLTLLISGLLALQRQRPVLAGIVVGCAGMLKPLPIVFLPYFVWTRQWRAVMAWTATVVLILVLSGWVMGPGALADYFGTVIQPRGANAIYWYEDQSLGTWAVRLWHPIRPHEFHVPLNHVRIEGVIMGWAFRLAMAGWLAWALWPRQPLTIQRRWRDWSLVSAGMLLLSPVARDYYAMFLLPGYVLLAVVLARQPRWWTLPACWWAAASYLLVGQGFPLGVIHHLPSVIAGVPNFQAYLHYGVPTIGYLCFVVAWLSRGAAC